MHYLSLFTGALLSGATFVSATPYPSDGEFDILRTLIIYTTILTQPSHALNILYD